MFIARQSELSHLQDLYGTDSFQLVIVYGRRRVGKSTLLREFCKDKPNASFFTARETTSVENLKLLSASLLPMEVDFGEASPIPAYQDFDSAIGAAFARARATRSILVIDEYPYLAQSYPGISSLLQEYVDREKDSSHLMLILCGSSMSFMEHQVLGHQSPLYGR